MRRAGRPKSHKGTSYKLAPVRDLFHLVFAPWPDGEPDPAPGMPRWGRAVVALLFIAAMLGGMLWWTR